ncbi:hypothetical protein ACSBR1_030817 [Camellia fascicularis]
MRMRQQHNHGTEAGIQYTKEGKTGIVIYELISRLVDQNQSQRVVISVVGMGGIGKTTLAKKVYDSQEVAAHFNYKAWITVSQSYKSEELLKTMIKQLSGNNVLPDEGIDSLIAKLKGYLYEKRYVVVFDDVWQSDFWRSIRHALPKNNKGSRVIITTRSEQVAAFCKETSMDQVHKLGALSEEKAWELFCQKAFQLDFGGHCPLELEKISHEIVRKCEGLPVAIVAIGGLLSTKNKAISEWQKFYDSMSTELERNSNLTSIRKKFSFSYNDLPHHLKSCFLYFGIILEDYSIKCGRLIRLFEEQKGKTMEEVAEEYLNELIHRRLVLVSTTKFDGRVRECRKKRIHVSMTQLVGYLCIGVIATWIRLWKALLQILEELAIGPSPQLKEVPSSIHHLQKLKTLQFWGMPEEFIDRMQPNQGKDYWIIERIPHVSIWSQFEHIGYYQIGNLQEYFDEKVAKFTQKKKGH